MRSGGIRTAPVTDAPPKKPHLSLLRSFVLADLITLANAACGTGAIFLCLAHLAGEGEHALELAFALLPLALVFDVLDGSVARWRRKQSPLGADLDSLADVISFGVAPAALGFTLGFRTLLDALVLVFFVCCGISRLARFNVTAAALSEGTGKVKYYEGTPIPASLLLVALLGVLYAKDLVLDSLPLGVVRLGGAGLHPLVLAYALSGAAMTSATLRIPKP